MGEQTSMLIDIQRSAEISLCLRYRYSLARRWGNGAPVLWVMLNPSTADAFKDDRTIGRCVGFARTWGFNAIEVVNLFAIRGTDPSCIRLPDSVGFNNDAVILEAVDRANIVVAAWGNHGAGGRGEYIRKLISARRDLHALRLTKEEQPEHPLYLPATLKPFVWTAKGGGRG
jgi:hypothetical protein